MLALQLVPPLFLVFVAGFVFRTLLFGLGAGSTDVGKHRKNAAFYAIATVALLVTGILQIVRYGGGR